MHVIVGAGRAENDLLGVGRDARDEVHALGSESRGDERDPAVSPAKPSAIENRTRQEIIIGKIGRPENVVPDLDDG